MSRAVDGMKLEKERVMICGGIRIGINNPHFIYMRVSQYIFYKYDG